MRTLKRTQDHATHANLQMCAIVFNERSQTQHQKLLEAQARPSQIQVQLDQLMTEYADLEVALAEKVQDIKDKEVAWPKPINAPTNRIKSRNRLWRIHTFYMP
jgi:hypothetical protein